MLQHGDVPPSLVLAANDDADGQFLLKRAFTKAGVNAQLRQVSDGEEAVRYLHGLGEFADRAQNPYPDLLLLDLKMPGLSGFDVLAQVRKHETTKALPVIVFSSSTNEEDVNRAFALGCNAYLVKPVDFSHLLDLVRGLKMEWLEQRGDRRSGSGSLAKFSRVVSPQAKSAKSATNQMSAVESPELFKLLVEQVKDYAIFLLDREGFVRSWNEGARRIKGYEASEIIGKHFSTFYPRADLDAEKPQFELRIATDIGRYEEEGWRLRKDGSRFWANVVITAVRDATGSLQGFAKVTRDLTQRKLQEENIQRLLETEERFRLLVEQVRDYAIFILDARGNVASWNQGARRIKQYTAEEIIGKHFSLFYTEEDLDAEKPAKELHTAIQEGRYEEEGWRVRKDGTHFWANVVITALWDKRGNLSGFAKVTRDLTQRREQEEALRRKNQELEQFAHTLSHDLRAPLRSICSFAQILSDESKEITQEESRSYHEKIYRSARSMEGLIDDILALSEASQSRIALRTVDLDDLVAETLHLMEGDISASRAQVQVASPLGSVRGNRTLLLQVITNLIANAIKFPKEGETPRIRVSAETTDDGREIHVTDEGLGIPSQVQESIFNVFDRGTADSRSKGRGIGLAIVKRAAERMDGSVEVVSQPGHGSDFILKVPLPEPKRPASARVD